MTGAAAGAVTTVGAAVVVERGVATKFAVPGMGRLVLGAAKVFAVAFGSTCAGAKVPPGLMGLFGAAGLISFDFGGWITSDSART